MSTRIYLDVDGVINAYDGTTVNPSVETSGWSRWEQVSVSGYLIKYAPDLLARLSKLNTVWSNTELVWLTTWRTMAVTDLSPAIGFDTGTRMRVLTDGLFSHGYRPYGFDNSQHWWKADAAVTDLLDNPVDNVIWIDDDLPHYRGAVSEVRKRVPATRFWTLPTRRDTGITVRDADMVTQWVDLLEAVNPPAPARPDGVDG